MASRASPANSLTELDLLDAIIARTEAEATRRGTSPGRIMTDITNDTRFWGSLLERRDTLKAAAPAGRSIKLDMRDRLLREIAKLEREKVAANAA